MALAFLAKIYSCKNGLFANFLIVDHKLRPESTSEAKFVKKILKKFNIKSEILTWNGKKPKKNLQSLSRKKRYELLLKKCQKSKINHIMLGHHQEDFFENFFIRLLRGSGLKGLVSFDVIGEISKKNLLRPLLDQKKKDLEYISKNVFGLYVEDPSNKNEKFLRVRIRRLIDNLKFEGLDQIKFFKTIKNLKNSNNVIKFYVKENLRNNSRYLSVQKKLILKRTFFEQPQEVIFRSFSDSIKFIGKKHYSPRGKKLQKIINNIQKNQLFRVTLGNCIIESINQSIIITKEH